MPNESRYQQPMQPWHELEPFGQRLKLQDKNLELFFYEAGEDQPMSLLMLHGLGDEADTWRHVVKPLSRQYHVIAIDLPGFGRSPTLVLRGEYDGLFSAENAHGVINVQPNAEIKIISEAGHLPHQEKPEAFLKAVQNWLEKTFSKQDE